MRFLCFLLLCGLLAGCSKDAGPIVAVGDPKDNPSDVKAPEEKSTLPLWIKELGKQVPEKQIAAINTIVEISKIGDDVIPSLVEALKDKKNAGAGMHFSNKPNSTREAIVLCLFKLGPKGETAITEHALPLLQQALSDPDSTVREHAAWTLVLLKDKAKVAQKNLLPLIADEERTVRYAGYQALEATKFDQSMEVLKLLKHMNPLVRSDAAEALNSDWLPKLKADAVPLLVEALKDEDSYVHKVAAEKLGELGPQAKDAIPPLIAMIKATTEEQLKNTQLRDLVAMIALRRIGEPAVPALIELLADKNFLARYQAAIALGMIGKPAKLALAPLTELMKTEQESADVLMETAVAVFLIGGDAKEPLDALMKVLDRTDLMVQVRARMVQTLARFGPKAEPAVEELVKLLKSPDEPIRKAVVVVLKNVGSGAKKAVPHLSILLSDEELPMRLAAAEILKGLGSEAKPAIPELITALSDSDDVVRRMAAETLMAFGPEAKSAVPELAKALVNKEYRVEQRVIFADALAAIGPDAKEAVPSLIDTLTSGDAMLKLASAKAIGRVGPAAKDAVPKLIERMQKGLGGERNAAILALGLIGADAKDAIEPLKSIVAKSTSDQKIWAAAALVRITPTDAKQYVTIVMDALNDKTATAINVSMRYTAIDTLELLGGAGKDATPELVKLSKDAKLEIRLQAIRGLAFVTTDGKSTVPPLLRLLNDKEIKIRQAAIRALGVIGPNASDAVPRLKEIVDSATAMSDEARTALAKIEKK